MTAYKFPLATSSWTSEEYDAIQRVIASDRYSMGDEVAEFERSFAAYVGSRYAVMVNSGSSANLLMVAALRYSKRPEIALMPGDEVIVPAVSWSTTYYPLHQYGLKQRFVDIDLHSLNYDLDALERAITAKTRAIMVVNLLGNPNDFARIKSIIGDRNIVILEDNCESMGAEFGGRKAGTIGLVGSFSCFFSHHISTMEGGVVVTDDKELYHIMLSIRAHGWTRNLPKFNHVTGKKSDNLFEESFKFVLPGYNLRPLEMSGAIGIAQVRKLPELIAKRRENAAAFVTALAGHPDLLIQREIGASSWFGFSLIIRPGSSLSRQALLDRLNGKGFECRPIVSGNFVKNEVMKYMEHDVAGALPNAEHLDNYGLFIGNHHYPIPEAIEALKAI